MNTLLVIMLVVAIPVYALHWHNQPARPQREKTTAIEVALTFLFDFSWLTRITALVAHWVASSISMKRQTASMQAPNRTQR